MSGPAEAWPAPGARLRAEGWRFAELAALCAFAVVQPVLGPLGESPQTFVGLGAGSSDIVLLAIGVALVPPLVVLGVGVLVGLGGARARELAHLVSLGVLAALAAVAIVRELNAGPGARVAAGVGVGLLAAVVVSRWLPARTFLRFASVAPLVLAGAFLLVSPVSSLVFPVDDGGEAAASPSEGAGDDPPGDDASEPPPVVMLVFDELPTLSLMDGDGGIDAELFPNLARLADTSTWYRDATTVSPKTAVALPALLSGQAPERDDWTAASYAEHPDTIFRLLGETHQLNVHQWATELCSPQLCGSDDGPVTLSPEATALLDEPRRSDDAPLASLADEATELWWTSVWPFAEPSRDFAPAGVDDAHDLAHTALEFLSDLDEGDADDERPTFDYLHAAVPHQPWFLLPSGKHYETPYPSWGMGLSTEPGEFAIWDDDEVGERWAEVGRSSHLLQVQWTDRLIGAVIDRLEELDRWDDAVVVVTSDHGVSFQPGHSLRAIRPASQVEIAWVPLLVKAPGQTEGQVVDDDVWLVDVLPTIAELVGVEVPWALDGSSLLDGTGRPSGQKLIVVNEPEHFDVVDPDSPHHLALDADGLEALRRAPAVGAPRDELRVWRHGPHADLLGERVDDVGVCAGTGPTVDVTVADDWNEQLDAAAGPGALPLWLEGTVAPDADGREAPREIAVELDGRVAALGGTRSMGGREELGALLAEPLAVGAEGAPAFYEIVAGEGCSLLALPEQ